MPVPDFQTAMLPVLEAFAEGAESVGEVLPILRARFAVTDDEAAQMIPSGRLTLLQSRAHWARTYLSKAGLLASPRRNRHVITDEGRRVLASRPGRIDMAFLKQFDTYRAWQAEFGKGVTDISEVAIPERRDVDSAPSAAVSRETPDVRLVVAHSELQAALASSLLDAVIAGTPAQFERLIVDLLIKMGYGRGDPEMGQRLGRSGDGGIDGVVNEDALGLDAVYIQAKKNAPGNNVGRPSLQAFVGALTGEGATKGVFVTTSDFTRDARDYLNKIQHRIVLVNGRQLADLMIRYQVGARAEQTYVVSEIDENYFSETGVE